VAAGVIFLGERLTPAFVAAALLVAAGIVLVNLRAGRAERAQATAVRPNLRPAARALAPRR